MSAWSSALPTHRREISEVIPLGLEGFLLEQMADSDCVVFIHMISLTLPTA